MKKIFISSNEMMNFNEIFRKNVTCDNIKSHQTSGLHPLFTKNNFEKNTAGVKLTPPQSF